MCVYCVLFVVRSLGSVALRKAQAYSFHFNYFTIDFNEELTGIYGATLWQQTGTGTSFIGAANGLM